MKLKFLLIYFVAFFIFFNQALSLENKILFKVNNEIITSVDIDNEFKYLSALNPKIKNLSQNEIFEISKKSIIKEIIKRIENSKNINNPSIDFDYLENVLKNIYQGINIQNLDDFKNYLKINNVEYQNVVEKIKTEVLWNELIYAKYSKKIKIDKKKIKEKLIKERKEFSKSYSLSEIFFEIENFSDLKNKFSEIKKTIDEKGFDYAALNYSTSNTYNIGGNLGWINEDSLNNNLRKIISDLKKGEFSDPIIAPGGFLILKINEIKKIKNNKNVDDELQKIIRSKQNNQLSQYSKIYYNKIKKDIQINEL